MDPLKWSPECWANVLLLMVASMLAVAWFSTIESVIALEAARERRLPGVVDVRAVDCQVE